MGCNQGCLAATWFAKPVGCLVNGECGYEHVLKQEPAAARKDLLVIGAGPAGMEFAVRASQRGHKVTIWERSDRIGGQLHMVSTPPGKHDFQDLVHYYEVMLKKHQIRLELNKEAVPDEIAAAGFDEAIVATGARPRTIPIQDNKGACPWSRPSTFWTTRRSPAGTWSS